MSDKRENIDPVNASAGYEKRDVDVKKVVYGAVFVSALLIFFFLMLDGLFSIVRENVMYETYLKPVSPKLIEQKAHVDSVLTNYKILDSSKGVYQIPIDKAIEITVSESKK